MHFALHIFKTATTIFPLLIDSALRRSHQSLIKHHTLLTNYSLREQRNSNTTKQKLVQKNQRNMSSLDSFSEILNGLFNRGGGRRPQLPNDSALDENTETWMRPTENGQARLTIVQITDVYTLDNFASLKTMLRKIRASQGPNDKVVSMLTGDFLAPYLLSSIDHGTGMMMAINETPIDYLTWGNHEADIPHPDVCKHVRSYKGTFINSNMQDHEAMDAQVPYEVIEITSEDGKQSRKIGFIAVLSDDPKLYSGFKAPGAFGGATIEDPWEILAKYQKELEEEHGCDLVIPLEHLYVHENTKTTEMFDFPVILSGHDHHRIDQMINGTRVIKPGMDGVFATVLEVVWDANSTKPRIRSNFVEVSKFEPCPALKAKTDAAYDVLDPLRNTMLAGILPQFRPLTSKNARGSVCTMGKLVCSMIRQSLLQTQGALNQVDAVILMGGNIRGNEDYPDDSFFSLETLEAEVKSDEVIGIVDMPGHVMAAGIESTHAGDPKPGWFQYDDGIKEENGRVTTVAGIPIQPDRIYRVATKIKDLTNGQSPPMKEYYEANPDLLPSKGSYVNIHSELMGFFARNLFRKLWDATGELIGDPADALEEASQPANLERIEGKLRLSVLDRDGDGYLTIDDIHYALRDFLGLSVDDNYKTLAEAIHSYADVTGTGKVTVEDFEAFCTDMPRNLELQAKWEEAFPDPVPELTNDTNVVSSFPEGPFMKRRDTEATAKIDSGSSDDSQDGSDLSYQNLPGEITIAKLPQELQ